MLDALIPGFLKEDFLLQNEAAIRLVFFLSTLIGMGIWEFVSPRRPRPVPRAERWFNNLGIVLINTLVVRILIPVLPVGFALVCEENQWGLFNLLDLPETLELIAAIALLDGLIYLQHIMFHAVPLLWRLHRVHHADLDLDVTSGNRFHPIEILISVGIKLCAVFLLGASAAAVIIFEVVLNGLAQFNHSNVYIPSRIDSLLRYFIVTPDMHRIHHSTRVSETNSNFGFNLSIWDRVFGTYRDQPRNGIQGMTIGLESLRDPNALSLAKLIVLPLKNIDERNTFTEED